MDAAARQGRVSRRFSTTSDGGFGMASVDRRAAISRQMLDAAASSGAQLCVYCASDILVHNASRRYRYRSCAAALLPRRGRLPSSGAALLSGVIAFWVVPLVLSWLVCNIGISWWRASEGGSSAYGRLAVMCFLRFGKYSAAFLALPL